MILTPIAVTLAGVTAASVGLAVYTLVEGGTSHLVVDNKVLATMFAGTAMLLDVFKYLAWPAARQLIAAGQTYVPRLMICYAIVIAAFSGWAVFDLLDNRLAGRLAGATAGAEQRLLDLSREKEFSIRRLESLEADEARVRSQASELRTRGMATPALALEAEALERIRSDRAAERARLDEVSSQASALVAEPAPTLPRWVAVLLALGFATSLELVPVLIFLSDKKEAALGGLVPTQLPDPEPLKDEGFAATQEQLKVEKLPEKPQPEPVSEPAKEAPHPSSPEPTFTGMLEPGFMVPDTPPLSEEDQKLLEILLSSLDGLVPGTPVPIKPFARSVSIGNPRAGEIFKAAEAVGRLTKTTRGYVSA